MKVELLGQLRGKLAETRLQLRNPRLFTVVRRQLEARAERLRQEIDYLEHPQPFADAYQPQAPVLKGGLCFFGQEEADGEPETDAGDQEEECHAT